MAWIREVGEDEAEGALKVAYAKVAGARGKVSNVMRVQSLGPRAMEAHLDFYLAVMFDRSGLSREERELIAVVVSAENRCAYCVAHHAAALAAYWKDEARVRAAAEDYRSLDLPPRARAMLDYAALLTRDPGAVGAAHVEAMRAEGITDEEILNVNMVAGYFNFVNRLTAGLGVEASAEEVGGYRY
jgi:uncharacterized peroxidase-related enzyme